ncbi:MAG TPA: hypothetical protein VK897_14170 [Anaerolineales bacterium]|nr:hypothetical protein [Anaerolineales bacterium]
MPKEFYTEKDIEDLVSRGTRSLQVTENVVLTELAYEKANRLGLQLVSTNAENPPAAPVRPYISEQQTRRPVPTIGPAAPVVEAQPKPIPTPSPPQTDNKNDVEERIRSAVITRLGNQVDAKLLDNIIHRVVKNVGLK